MEAWEGRSHVEGGEVEQPFKTPPPSLCIGRGRTIQLAASRGGGCSVIACSDRRSRPRSFQSSAGVTTTLDMQMLP